MLHSRWERIVASFERQDRVSLPPPGGTVFVGSSNFARWKTLEADFKEFGAINRAFGGSCLPDVIQVVDRIIVPYQPSKVVIYGGPNEIGQGAAPEEAFRSFEELVDRIRENLPAVVFYGVSLKPAPGRASFDAGFKRFNALLLEKSRREPTFHLIDIVPVFTRPDGTLREELYVEDRVHMNRRGEEACLPVIAEALRR